MIFIPTEFAFAEAVFREVFSGNEDRILVVTDDLVFSWISFWKETSC